MSPLRTWSLRSRLILGVVLLSAFGFVLSSVVAQHALRGYLLDQIDNQLISLSSTSLPRIAESGIAPDSDDEFGHHDGVRSHAKPTLPTKTPLQRIPTYTSVTLLDPNGAIVGRLGGDLNPASVTDYLTGITPQIAATYQGRAFTVEGKESDFRAVALVLPNNRGTVVAAESLGELNKTVDKLGFFFLLIGLLLITLIAIASRIVIKIGMQPLEVVEVKAEEIAAGDLSVRMPDANPHTEVGRLVTSLNAMLTQIQSSFDAVTQSEEKLRRFVADASHELRTPLTAIRGFSELYRQGAINGQEQTRELMGRIEDESKRMGSLVEDLLLLARLDQSRKLDAKPVNLVDVVGSAVISARAAGPSYPVHFTPATDEIFALGDETRIHTPIGTEITVAIEEASDGVRISVSDNGPGISPENQERIFERFFRADSSRTRVDGEGSGLGLSIVDAVMKGHGGTVTVQSELGKGTTFTLFFPIAS
jgi:two-component system OmpR family sensor kinase